MVLLIVVAAFLTTVEGARRYQDGKADLATDPSFYALGSCAMGLVFGWAVEHTGRLWPGMGLHCLNNCIVLAGCLAERGLG